MFSTNLGLIFVLVLNRFLNSVQNYCQWQWERQRRRWARRHDADDGKRFRCCCCHRCRCLSCCFCSHGCCARDTQNIEWHYPLLLIPRLVPSPVARVSSCHAKWAKKVFSGLGAKSQKGIRGVCVILTRTCRPSGRVCVWVRVCIVGWKDRGQPHCVHQDKLFHFPAEKFSKKFHFPTTEGKLCTKDIETS